MLTATSAGLFQYELSTKFKPASAGFFITINKNSLTFRAVKPLINPTHRCTVYAYSLKGGGNYES